MTERGLEPLYQRIAAADLQPLWIDTASYVPRQPAPAAVPAHWQAETVLRLLRDAGDTVPHDLADRRVLVFKNPALPAFSGTTQTLYACLQLLRPGEHASAHRHSQSAFRFILSGEGAHTLINGRRVVMKRGDLIVTPHDTWHGHGNDSANEVIWLDGLDNGILRLFDATFFQLPFDEHENEHAADTVPPSASAADPHWYTWEAMQSLLDVQERDGRLDAAHGYRVRYTDPHTGKDPLPTMSAFLSRLPAGFDGRWYRSSDSVIVVAARGSGRTELDGRAMHWSENDVFTVPTWTRYRHVVSNEAVLFSFSDRNAQERLECWREERHAV